jgi:hypothetical protein
MAGGYGTDMEATVQVQMNTYRTAVEYQGRWHAMSTKTLTAATVGGATRWHNAAP